jgi:hypothetical protein
MSFVKDLINRLFKSPAAPLPSQEMVVVEEIRTVEVAPPPIKKIKAPEFDLKKEADPQAFLHDLQSIKPAWEEFDRARADLLQELRRLAPPKRSRFRKDAA